MKDPYVKRLYIMPFSHSHQLAVYGDPEMGYYGYQVEEQGCAEDCVVECDFGSPEAAGLEGMKKISMLCEMGA